MSADSAPRLTTAAQDLRMLEVLLRSRVPDALGEDPESARRVRDALYAGEELADIMLCLPGETDAVEAMLFARAAIDWWDQRLVVHDSVISSVA
jgi:hypothetical protein